MRTHHASTDLRLLAEILENGPVTRRILCTRLDRSSSAVWQAVQRLLDARLIEVVASGARKPGQHGGSTQRIYGPGKHIRSWAERNIKPKDDDE